MIWGATRYLHNSWDSCIECLRLVRRIKVWSKTLTKTIKDLSAGRTSYFADGAIRNYYLRFQFRYVFQTRCRIRFTSFTFTFSWNGAFVLLWPWTFAYDLDLRTRPRFGEDQPLCRISYICWSKVKFCSKFVWTQKQRLDKMKIKVKVKNAIFSYGSVGGVLISLPSTNSASYP